MVVVIEMEKMKYVVAELKRMRTTTTRLLNLLEKSRGLDFDTLYYTIIVRVDNELDFLSHKSLEEWKRVAAYPDALDEESWQWQRKRCEEEVRELLEWAKILTELFANEKDEEIYMMAIEEREKKLD